MYAFETSDCRVGIADTTYRAIVRAMDGDESAAGGFLDCVDQLPWEHSPLKTIEGREVWRESKLLGHDGEVCGTLYELRG